MPNIMNTVDKIQVTIGSVLEHSILLKKNTLTRAFIAMARHDGVI